MVEEHDLVVGVELVEEHDLVAGVELVEARTRRSRRRGGLAARRGSRARPGGGWLARVLLGAGARRSPSTKKLVAEIGKGFEFHRSDFSPEHVDAASAALDELYALFDCAPVARRVVHDGTSPIVVKATSWQKQHGELWNLLVPSSGRDGGGGRDLHQTAATVQGDVIRIAGRPAATALEVWSDLDQADTSDALSPRSPSRRPPPRSNPRRRRRPRRARDGVFGGAAARLGQRCRVRRGSGPRGGKNAGGRACERGADVEFGDRRRRAARRRPGAWSPSSPATSCRSESA